MMLEGLDQIEDTGERQKVGAMLIDSATSIIAMVRLPIPGEPPAPIAVHHLLYHGKQAGAVSIPLMYNQRLEQKLGDAYRLTLKFEAIDQQEFHRLNGFSEYPMTDPMKVV